jgi:hypothetical protein
VKFFFALLAFLSVLASAASAQVTPQRLLNPGKEPQNWLMYSGDYNRPPLFFSGSNQFRQRRQTRPAVGVPNHGWREI